MFVVYMYTHSTHCTIQKAWHKLGRSGNSIGGIEKLDCTNSKHYARHTSSSLNPIRDTRRKRTWLRHIRNITTQEARRTPYADEDDDEDDAEVDCDSRTAFRLAALSPVMQCRSIQG